MTAILATPVNTGSTATPGTSTPPSPRCLGRCESTVGTGQVQDDVPLQPKSHTSFLVNRGVPSQVPSTRLLPRYGCEPSVVKSTSRNARKSGQSAQFCSPRSTSMKGTPESRREVEAPAAGRDAPVRAVILVGFMGAGKTSVGRALGRHGLALSGSRRPGAGARRPNREEIFRDPARLDFGELSTLPFANCWRKRKLGLRWFWHWAAEHSWSQQSSLLEAAERRPCTWTRLQMNCGAAAGPIAGAPPTPRRNAFRQLYETRRPSTASPTADRDRRAGHRTHS